MLLLLAMSNACFAARIETSEPSTATRTFESSLALCIRLVLNDSTKYICIAATSNHISLYSRVKIAYEPITSIGGFITPFSSWLLLLLLLSDLLIVAVLVYLIRR